MLTGKEYSESETAMLPIVISYEDETGSVSTQTRNISLAVQQAVVEDWSAMEELPAEESGAKLPIWQIALIAVGGLILLIGVIAGIKAMKNKKKKREEEELALGITEYDIPDGDNKTTGKSDKDGD